MFPSLRKMITGSLQFRVANKKFFKKINSRKCKEGSEESVANLNQVSTMGKAHKTKQTILCFVDDPLFDNGSQYKQNIWLFKSAICLPVLRVLIKREVPHL